MDRIVLGNVTICAEFDLRHRPYSSGSAPTRSLASDTSPGESLAAASPRDVSLALQLEICDSQALCGQSSGGWEAVQSSGFALKTHPK